MKTIIDWIFNRLFHGRIDAVINFIVALVMSGWILFQSEKIDALEKDLLTQTLNFQKERLDASVTHINALREANTLSERYRLAADNATTDLIKTIDTIGRERDRIKGEIRNVTNDNSCRYGLSADGLRLYRAALGYPAGAGKNAVPDNSAGAVSHTGKTAHSSAGLSERDLLAHAADFGAWCRRIEQQLIAVSDHTEQTQ